MKQLQKPVLIFLSVLLLMMEIPGNSFALTALKPVESKTIPMPEKTAKSQQTAPEKAVTAGPESLVPAGALSSPTLDQESKLKPIKLNPILIAGSANGKTYDSKGRLIREALSGQKVRRIVYVMEDAHPVADCKADGDLGSCANHLIENKSAEETLEIRIPEGVFMLKKETILIFQKDDVVIQGAGENKTTLQLSESLAASRGPRADRYFSLNIIDSSRVTIDGLTLDGKNLVSQRGIAVTALGDRQVSDITIRNVEIKNFIAYAVLVGSTYTNHFASSYAVYGDPEKNTPERLRLGKYLQSRKDQGQEQFLYPAGYVKNFTFENNTVHLTTGMSIGLVFEGYAVKQVPDSVTITPENWFGIAQGVASKNSNVVIRGNTFIAKTNEIHAAIKISHAQDVTIEGNRILAEGFPGAFKGGAAINIGFNVLHAVIRNNEIVFPANHQYPQGGININSGFSNHDLFYGLGDKKLTSPSMDIRIEGNIFHNARIRFSDFSRNEPAYTAFADRFESKPPADENIQLSGNQFTLNQAAQNESALVWIATQKETILPQWYPRKNLQVIVSTGTEMITWIGGKQIKVVFNLGDTLSRRKRLDPKDILGYRLMLEDLHKKKIKIEAVVYAKIKSGIYGNTLLTLVNGIRSVSYKIISDFFPRKTRVEPANALFF